MNARVPDFGMMHHYIDCARDAYDAGDQVRVSAYLYLVGMMLQDNVVEMRVPSAEHPGTFMPNSRHD